MNPNAYDPSGVVPQGLMAQQQGMVNYQRSQISQQMPQPPQSLQGSMHPAHHAVYEKLRQVLMGLHQQGIPGMSNILDALNKQHVSLMGQQPLGKQPASPSNPTPQGYYRP